MDIGQADVAAPEAVREFTVIDSKQVEQGGMEIVDLEGIRCGLVTPAVRFPVG